MKIIFALFKFYSLYKQARIWQISQIAGKLILKGTTNFLKFIFKNTVNPRQHLIPYFSLLAIFMFADLQPTYFNFSIGNMTQRNPREEFESINL